MTLAEQQKKAAAEAALEQVNNEAVIGVGTGSTVNYFIDALASIKHKLDATVASSLATEQRLKQHGIPVVDLNSVNKLPVYVDGADEFNDHKQLIKGGGGALTREKIIAASAEKFICITDASKEAKVLGRFPLPIEVIPMARGYVARQLLKLGASPEYREGFKTDNGNIILDCYNFEIINPNEMERTLNNIVGVVTNGIFAATPADIILIGESSDKVRTIA